jgi:hypothetical protein
MKLIIRFYIVMLGVFYAYLVIKNISNIDLWMQPQTWFQWLAYMLGLFALVSYSYSFHTFTYVRAQKKWLAVLLFMLSFYYYQLHQLGIFNTDIHISMKMNILINYVIWVFPSVICTAHLAFREK